MNAVRIWDLPVRLFHWLFAASCAVAWLSGDDARYTDLHLFAGYLALGLVLFRIGWGFIGGHYARFNQFVRGPAAVLDHLRQLFDSSRHHQPGHNPAGALAILVMLALVLLLGVTGLIVLGGEEGGGPLAGVFKIAEGVAVHRWHDGLAWALLAVVVLHLAGVVLESLLQRQNLLRSMVTGLKMESAPVNGLRNFSVVGWLLLLVVSGYTTVWFIPYSQDSEAQPYLPFVEPELAQSALWQGNCSECHMAYHPGLLPERSWQRLLEQQGDHFGEDLFLQPEAVAALRAYAVANSAEQVKREASWRTLRSLAFDESPLRITDTPYWKQVHRDIDKRQWMHPSVNGKYNCAACHQDAEHGGFMNGAMRLPE